MRIFFLSHYFPPEVNAPANRTFEHCREWVRQGHDVHVVTGFPSHPTGRIYPGYKKAWYRYEVLEGIQVHRVWTYFAANQGVFRRSLNYISFVPSSVLPVLRLQRPDVIVATSPQFFNAVAGWVAGALTKTPWVFELRDLWPESISAVGALRLRGMVKLLEHLELRLYRDAAAIVSVTRSFIDNLVSRGVPREKLFYIPNGVFPEDWQLPSDPMAWREARGIGRESVLASYVGTVGMAHGVGTILDAAAKLHEANPEVVFLIVGDGAERSLLEKRAKDEGLANVIFSGQVSRQEAREAIAASDISLVILRDAPLFRTVLPSKMFEAMAAGKPIVLGVRGEAESVLREARAGLCVPPEDHITLAQAVEELAGQPELRNELGQNGRALVETHFHRRNWAHRYARVLQECVSPAGAESA